MNVSVLLVAYHGDRWMAPCVASLAGASGSRLHLLLVDNAGNTGLDRLPLGPFDVQRISTPRPLGFAEANNLALVEASALGDVVLFLNQDTISPPGWIDACRACFERDPALGAVAPLIRTYDDAGWDPSFLDCLSPDVRERLDEGELPEVVPTVNAPAPALLVRTDVLREVGPFDPVFGSYYEDYDLCRRIRRAGYRIGFCRDARVRHYSGSTTTTRERELKRMRQIIRNRTLYRLREEAGARWPALVRQFGVDLPVRLVRGVLGTPSSQPPHVTLRACGDLLKIGGRLASRRRDERAWHRYLEEIGWPHRVPAFRAAAGVTDTSEAARTIQSV